MLKILLVSSEVAPYAKTGGLADVAGSLPKALAELGHDVKVALPKYKMVDDEKYSLQRFMTDLPVTFGGRQDTANIKVGKIGDAVEVFLIENGAFYLRDQLYGFADDVERFLFFQRAVLTLLKEIPWKPDVIHCNDWQTGFIPVYLSPEGDQDPFYQETATLFTIHNLAYQGVFPSENMALTGLSKDLFTMDKLEFYGQLNLMKAGLVYADLLNTVSSKYAEEIQTVEFGERLEGVLQGRKDRLSGIVNGIDYEEWNPATDKLIKANYSCQTLGKKKQNKKALLKTLGLPEKIGAISPPLIGCVSRLSSQKGFDLVSAIADPLMKLGAQLVVLGAGDETYEGLFRSFATKYPQQVAVKLGKMDNTLAHQIYAGCDLFLMPSRYEPCGLGQLISLAYGTIPIVRCTGGLADTIQDFNPADNSGTGFVFEEYSAGSLLATIQRAVQAYFYPKAWESIMRAALLSDFSWDASAKKYVALYEKAKKLRLSQ